MTTTRRKARRRTRQPEASPIAAALRGFVEAHNRAYEPLAQIHRMKLHAQRVIDSTPVPPVPPAEAGRRWTMPPAVADAREVLDLIEHVYRHMESDAAAAVGHAVRMTVAYLQMSSRVLAEPVRYGLEHLTRWRDEWLDMPPGKLRTLLETIGNRNDVAAAELMRATSTPTVNGLDLLLSRLRHRLPDGWSIRRDRDRVTVLSPA